jgi:hypothetical protein
MCTGLQVALHLVRLFSPATPPRDNYYLTLAQTDTGFSGSYSYIDPISQVLQLSTNTQYEVWMYAYTAAEVPADSGTVTVDPTFQIDPSQSNGSAYSLEFSPNVGDSPAVPEPASLPLLGTAVAGIGLAAWRRRK